MTSSTTAILDPIARLGLVREPTEVTEIPAIAATFGLDFFGVKRDDLGEALYGGAKPRKLDYLLASPPFADAEIWSGAGAIGSGSLVALTAAAKERARRVDAHMFWTPLSAGVEENLAFTASGPTRVFFYPSRAALTLRAPAMFGAAPARGRAIVPPGATSGVGMVGLVRAGLELAEQIRSGSLPEPDRVLVALGSGGTAAGLSVGLGLAGLRTTVFAVAVVEHVLSMRLRMASLEREVLRVLAAAGIDAGRPAPIVLHRAELGRGYARTTRASLDAVARYATDGLALEPIYTGKAMAALGAVAAGGGRRVLFWQTARRGPIPHAPDYRERLPPELARALAEPARFERRIARRRVLVGVAAAITATVAVRASGYPAVSSWSPRVLAAWEVSVLRAAAEAVLPFATAAQLAEIAPRVDRYLNGMPPEVKREVHGLLVLIEQGSPLGGHLARLTRLAPAERAAQLEALEARGGLIAQAARGLRDLCVFAFYAQPSTWSAIGYEGPRQPLTYDPKGPERWAWPRYDALVAPRGATPRGIVG